ncbi:MAG: VOC family protein [bacterium]|nr:VOC family protein [bacterium]
MKRLALLSAFLMVFTTLAKAAPDEFSSKTVLIGMIVSDMDASVKFYKDVVGFTEYEGFSVDADFGERSGLTDSLPLTVRVFKLGPGADATQLKLIEFKEKAQKQQNDFIHSHTGVQYLTIRVTELQPILDRIKKNNVKMLGKTPIELSGRDMFVLIKDPDGTFVELIGPLTAKKRFDSVFK